MATDKTAQKREGPNPPNILLTALRRAIRAGVDSAQLGFALDMAISATRATGDGSPRKQADTFRQVADTLDGWSDEIKSGEPVAP